MPGKHLTLKQMEDLHHRLITLVQLPSVACVAVGCSKQTAQRYHTQWGGPPLRPVITDEQRAEVLRLWDEPGAGRGAPDVAKLVGITTFSVYKILHAADRSTSKLAPRGRRGYKPGTVKWTPEHLEALRRLYPMARSEEVKAAIPHPWGSILATAYRLGLRRDPLVARSMTSPAAHPLLDGLRLSRLAAGLTLVDLGAKAGLTPSAIGYWERGKYTPNFRELLLWASALGVSVEFSGLRKPKSLAPKLSLVESRIMDVMRAGQIATPSSVRTTMQYLRVSINKLRMVVPEEIETVWGVGYKFADVKVSEVVKPIATVPVLKPSRAPAVPLTSGSIFSGYRAERRSYTGPIRVVEVASGYIGASTLAE